MKSPLRALLAFATLALAARSPAAEIVSNGSFETQTNGSATGWSKNGLTAGLSIATSSLSPHTGTQALRVTGRGDPLDGPKQNVTAALAQGASGRRYVARAWVRLDDFASVRLLLRFGDTSGAHPDLLLAERIVLTAGQWTLVEGSAAVSWTGSLTSATLLVEVVQLARATETPPARVTPAYSIDDVSMDLDTDGDGIMDREEAAGGFNSQAADTDADGLPDRWERDHAFSPVLDEAELDPDNDGFTNRQEFFAATDPRALDSYPGRPSDPDANARTRAVLRYLALLPSAKTGGHLAIGQTVTDLSSPTEYAAMIDGLAAATGRYPAIFSIGVEGPNGATPLQIQQVEPTALAYWQAGGLVLWKWAVSNPWTGASSGDQTDVDIPGLLDPASSAPGLQAKNQAARDTLLGWMSAVADSLERLDAQGVVVMFRPMSEMNGPWFWWGHRERSEYVNLWRFVHDYFAITRNLHNLIWVYESDSATHAANVPGGSGAPSDYYYPGDDLVDVMCHNLYNDTWVLSFDANEVYSRYPKIYGVPQAGPAKTLREGTFSNLVYLDRTEAAFPRSSFVIAWNSFTSTNPVTGIHGYQHLGLVDNLDATALMNDPSIVTRETLPASLFTASAPVVTSPPAARSVALGATTTLNVAASGVAPVTYQWLRDAQPIAGAASASYTIASATSDLAGLYAVDVTDVLGRTSSGPFIFGVATTAKVAGAATELAPHDIVHPNGRIFDQILLGGAAATITADSGQVTRISFIDLSDDIVQVEFSGAGSLTLVLDAASDPAPPLKYHQPAVSYMKGHAHIVIVDADETTNVSAFTVGRATAFDPTGAFDLLQPIGPANAPASNGSSLFLGQEATSYDGFADLAYIAILSRNGKFGGIRTANASYFAARGFTGIYAPDVQFTGPVYLGDIAASDEATPVLLLGSTATDVLVTGGNLHQANGRAVQVSGIARLAFTDGSSSHGLLVPAQANAARLEQNGVDVTSLLVANPNL